MAFPRWDRLDFQPYFRAIADLLALKDWTIIVKDESPDDGDANATVNITYGRKRAIIRLSENFLKDDESDQRHTAVHELIHCHLDTHGRLAENAVADTKPYRLLLEIAVDGLTDAVAPFLPLPSAILGSPGLPEPNLDSQEIPMAKQSGGPKGKPMPLGKSPAPPAMEPKSKGKPMAPKGGGKKGGGGMGSCK